MGNSQSTAFQTALKKFATLERKQFLERTFIEALRRLFGHYRANKSNYAKTWMGYLRESLVQIYDKRVQVEKLLALLSSESYLQILNENELFRLVMEKCHSDPRFSCSCWDFKTSDWSDQNVESFFRNFAEVLQITFLDIFDNSVMRPDLLNLEKFHSYFPVEHEREGNLEYNSTSQRSVLIQMLEVTIERVMIFYHYPRENASDDTSYLTASNGTRVFVSTFFVRNLDQFWVDLILICGSHAESEHFCHETLLRWYITGERIMQ
jgi:hypothetical protein